MLNDNREINAAMFRCRECGATFARWLGQCARCDAFGSVVRTLAGQTLPLDSISPQGGSHAAPRAPVEPTHPLPVRPPGAHENTPVTQLAGDAGSNTLRGLEREPAAPIRITDVEDDDLERIATGIAPLDTVLGGGLVPAGIYVIGGEAGCGKSTLVAQLVAAVGLRCLYVTGEETIEKATLRARRIDATHPEIWIVASNDVDETIAHARALAPAILVVDSIQTMTCADVGGTPGSVSQVKGCGARLAAFANDDNVIVFMIGHVTKDGELAGPSTLKHLVDVVLSIETGEEFQASRILRSSKNRFGSTAEIGVFQMTADGLAWNESPDEVLIKAMTEHDTDAAP